ncbi:MAG: flagellar motor protein MotB [Nitrospirae bacterium]|nr:flagellar motor protein MotB [Nitrospirota bacterium]
MDINTKPRIIVRKGKGGHGGHHGGAWKIAYADFVTAMMAFFLLMWLLGSTSQAQREGIAEYFQTPLKVALSGGSSVGDRTSILPGGGDDLTQSDGQVKKANMDHPVVDLEAAKTELARQEVQKLTDLKAQVAQAIESNPDLAPYRDQILLDMTMEGLRIQIMDQDQKPMFDVGSTKLAPYTRAILHEIGQVLNKVSNHISISGHTDSASYQGGSVGYSNWELSADRANSARRELLTGGMQDDRIMRVAGMGPAVPFDQADPASSLNRRISVVVLNKQSEDAINDGGSAFPQLSPMELDMQAEGITHPAPPAPVNPAPVNPAPVNPAGH